MSAHASVVFIFAFRRAVCCLLPELALQIFDVLRLVGERHDFAAGLIIGGKSFSEEQKAIHRMNFLISTPGRLLHHFEHTPG